MKTYKVLYNGNSTRFNNFEYEIDANSEREAVEKVFQVYLDDNYFPQNDGSIKDCDGDILAEANDNVINYDGGYFYAEVFNEN